MATNASHGRAILPHPGERDALQRWSVAFDLGKAFDRQSAMPPVGPYTSLSMPGPLTISLVTSRKWKHNALNLACSRFHKLTVVGRFKKKCNTPVVCGAKMRVSSLKSHIFAPHHGCVTFFNLQQRLNCERNIKELSAPPVMEDQIFYTRGMYRRCQVIPDHRCSPDRAITLDWSCEVDRTRGM